MDVGVDVDVGVNVNADVGVWKVKRQAASSKQQAASGRETHDDTGREQLD